MKKLVDFYVANPRLIGAIYCAVPAVIWFAVVLASVPFREVYVLRLALCLILGWPIGAYLNRHFLNLWLMKHKSSAGPATVADGAINGAAIGLGIALLPALTALISTHHLEEAKAFIIAVYLLSALTGGIVGGTVTVAGGKYIER